MRRARSFIPAVAALAAAIAGSFVFFFYFRDNFSTHYPIKFYSAPLFRSAIVPWWNFGAGGGQPLAGNPTSLTFYPDNLLYLIFPAYVAFNLHFVLHFIVGYVAMAALARHLGADRGMSHATALIYVLSGSAISTLAFYNLVPSIALFPLIFLFTERFLIGRDWRSALFLGASCGLLGVVGEPVMILGASIVIGFLAVGRVTRDAIAPGIGAIAASLAVASPLLVAYSEIAGEVERGLRPFFVETVLTASLSPARLAEIVVGPFRGLITELGPNGFVVTGRWPPFLPVVFIGMIIIAPMTARLQGPLHRLRLAAIVLLFLALGSFNPIVVFLVREVSFVRFIRFPEKCAIAFTVAAVALAGTWLSSGRNPRPGRVVTGVTGVLIAAFGIMASRVEGMNRPSIIRLWCGIAIALLVLGFLRRIDRPFARRAILAFTIVPLAYWAVRAAPIDLASYYLRPSPLAPLTVGRRWSPEAIPLRHLPFEHTRAQYRLAAQAEDPLFGLTQNVDYAFDPSPEGMYSWASRMVRERMTVASAGLRVRYLRMLGVGTVVSPTPLETDGLVAAGTVDINANTFFVYHVRDPLPEVQPIQHLIGVRSIQEAVGIIESPGFDPEHDAVVPASAVHFPAEPMTVARVVKGPQQLLISVHAPRGGVIVVNESFFRAWRARSGSEGLPTFSINVDRLAVVVPPGQHEITLEFGRRHVLVGACMALSAVVLMAALLTALLSRRTPPGASPAFPSP